MSDDREQTALTVKQHNAVAALLNAGTVRQAAVECGVNERTLYRWLKDPAFSAEYRAARREAVQAAIARMQQLAGHAVNVLVTVMARDTSPPAVRVAAASKILDLAIQSVELEDLAARLAALKRLGARKDSFNNVRGYFGVTPVALSEERDLP